MYASYWNLSSSPFQNGVELRWFHDSPVHEEALARLLFVIEQRRRIGFLCGASGTGKSLLLKVLAKQVPRSQRLVAHVDLSGLSGSELLACILESLQGFAPRGGLPALVRDLEDSLDGVTAAGTPIVLLFDRADRARPESLELIERLATRSADRARLVSCVIAARGQEVPVAGRFLRDLADLRIELNPLTERETIDYVRSLLEKAGSEREIFESSALRRIHALTEGIPRQINRVCELSLLAGMADGRDQIDAELVGAAAEELPASPIGMVRGNRLQPVR